MTQLVDLSVSDLLRAISAPTPTPGGGSASALAGAVGAALLAMVAGMTKTRGGAAPDRAALDRALPGLLDGRDHLAGLEAHLLLVETASAGHVGNRDIRHDRSVLQHPAMILAGTPSRLSTADGRAAIGVIVRPGSISQAIAAAQRGSLDGMSSSMARMSSSWLHGRPARPAS